MHTSIIEVLRPPLASAQYTSIANTDRLEEIGAAPSIGTVGDSFDNAMAESVLAATLSAHESAGLVEDGSAGVVENGGWR